MSFETGGAVRTRGRRFHENANEIYRLPSFDYLSEDALKKFIEKHETEQVPRLKKLKDYFLNHTDIKYRNDRADEERADYRMSHNFARYISILIQGYILGKPLTYNHENENLLAALNEFNDRNKEQSHNSNLELNLSIYGRAFELVYMNQQSEECMAMVDPIQAFLIYDTTVEGNVVAGVRYFNVQIGEDVERFIEVYDDQKIYKYQSGENLENMKFTGEQQHYFEGVPLIEYWNNDDRIGDFETVLDQIDGYDVSHSDTLNGMEDFADSYLVLAGQPNTESEDIQEMKKSRVIVLDDPTNEGIQPNAFYLTKTYDVAGEEAFKNRTVNDIHKFSFTPDLSDEEFSSNVSGEAMKYKLFILDQLRSTKERLFKEALMVRLRLVAQMWKIKRKDANIDDLEIVFTPNLPTNTSELVQTAKDVTGIVSEETQLSILPFIEDVQAEIERKKAESRERRDMYEQQPLFKQGVMNG
ncbi:phage portal protein [Priestia filamentosa]|uniref:phage portal protein n=1 Tax=Priestia filamentosa TaxID=1402861 RepID=UPI003F1570EB